MGSANEHIGAQAKTKWVPAARGELRQQIAVDRAVARLHLDRNST
jgi:hypothetical protein